MPCLRSSVWGLCLGLALGGGLRAGQAIEAAPPLVALADNGRVFCLPDRRLSLHCLDLPGLLAMDAASAARDLSRAAAAGFNSVSFEAPLFGPRGLCPKLGQFGGPAVEALTAVLRQCGQLRLYAFPVLYPPQAVDGLVGAATKRDVFFQGRRSWGWQRWALGRASRLKVNGVPLGASSIVGGWLLYRGPWPGGPPLISAGRQASARASVDETRLKAWTVATVRSARALGFRQELGVGLLLGADLPAGDPSTEGAAIDGAPPMAPLASGNVAPSELAAQEASLDALPPVPGVGAVDDSGVLPPAPDEGGPASLKWDLVGSFLGGLSRSGGLDFVECTFDTEDWFNAAAHLSTAASDGEVPVLWRQDWRAAPSYERARHMRTPPSLAGLEGPWPEDGWPSKGAVLWPLPLLDARSAPFAVRAFFLRRSGSRLRLRVVLSRPASLGVDWGRTLPLDGHVSAEERSALERSVTLGPMPPGAWFLLRIRADSPRYGTCLLRTRWVRAPL